MGSVNLIARLRPLVQASGQRSAPRALPSVVICEHISTGDGGRRRDAVVADARLCVHSHPMIRTRLAAAAIVGLAVAFEAR
jgi:hypothetical protein